MMKFQSTACLVWNLHMIKVQGLTNDTPALFAVDNISFEVEKGQNLAFSAQPAPVRLPPCVSLLLPPPTMGTANVAVSTSREPHGGQKRILPAGMPPPSIPNGGDRVSHLRRQAQGHPSATSHAASTMSWPLRPSADVRTRLSASLPRAFRQRVGLAQALSTTPGPDPR